MDIQSYYLTKMKKKTKAARIIDLVFFRILLFGVVYVLFLYRTHIALSALIMSLSIVVSFSLLTAYYDRRKLKKFIAGYQKKLRLKCAFETISRMPKTQFDKLVEHLFDDMGYVCEKAGEGYIDASQKAYIAVLKRYPEIHSTLQDLTEICAVAAEYSCDRCYVFSVTDFEKRAHELAGRIQWPEIHLFPAAKLLEVYEKYFEMPTDEEVNLIIKNEIASQKAARRARKSSIFRSANIFKYFICAAVIYFAGILVPSMRIYYIAFSSLALCFAFISAFMSTVKTKTD